MAAVEGAAAPTLLDRLLRPGRSSSRDVMLDIAWLVGLGLLFMATGLGLRDPWPPDEPRFALVAQDMLRTGDWLIPRVGGDLYADKPPLFFWLIAVATSLTGSLRVGFLLPSLLAGLGTLLLTYDLLRRVRGREVGLAAAFVLLLTFQFVWQARQAQIDAVLCFFTTLSLYGLLRHHCLGPARGWYLVGWAAAGLGVITKGVGFLPLLALVPFVLLARRGWPAAVKRVGSLGVAGVAAMLVAIGLWFVPMIVATSAGGELLDYRNEILFHQTLTRYADAWHHHAPVYYYFVEIIPLFWLPLIALVPWLWPRWRAAFRDRDTMTAVLLAWVVIVVLFFTASSGKRGLYVLPAVPALAMAAGPWLPELLRARGPRRLAFVLACVLTGFAGLAAAYLGFDADRTAAGRQVIRHRARAAAHRHRGLRGAGARAVSRARRLARVCGRAGVGARADRVRRLSAHRCRALGPGVHRPRRAGKRRVRRAGAGRREGAVPAGTRSADLQFRARTMAGVAGGGRGCRRLAGAGSQPRRADESSHDGTVLPRGLGCGPGPGQPAVLVPGVGQAGPGLRGVGRPVQRAPVHAAS